MDTKLKKRTNIAILIIWFIFLVAAEAAVIFGEQMYYNSSMLSFGITLRIDEAQVATGYDEKTGYIYSDGYKYEYTYDGGSVSGEFSVKDDKSEWQSDGGFVVKSEVNGQDYKPQWLQDDGFVVNWDNVHVGETYYLNDDETMTDMFNSNKKMFGILALACIAPACTAIVALFILYLRKLPDENGELKTAISVYDKIPLALQITLCITACVLTIVGFLNAPSIIRPYNRNDFFLFTMNSFGAPILAAFFLTRTVISIIRQIRTKQLVKLLLTYRLLMVYKKFIYKKKLMIRVIILTLPIAIIEPILICFYAGFIPYSNFLSPGMIFLLFMIIVLPLSFLVALYRILWNVQKLSDGISAMSKNELPKPNTIRQYEPLKDTYDELISLNNLMIKSIDEAVKSEHMKIELLTNVSHDLKTPLTSIISYIDLLSKTELNEEARDYVSVIQRKSERLSGMVCDVFDLAKVNSGEVPVEIEKLDMTKLLQQTLVDMADKIEASGRVVKEIIPDVQLFISADGKRLYRVFQNLIDNALKYSLNGSRVFVELQQFEHSARLVITNTSAYEIEFTADELKERFTRGDKSRSSEGSGLGLSIADSFVTACGGELDIATDGDQFRAIVKFETL